MPQSVYVVVPQTIVRVTYKQPNVAVPPSEIKHCVKVSSAHAFVARHVVNPKPTFRFGTKWEIKNAEIWD